jgi:hypothetical protein
VEWWKLNKIDRDLHFQEIQLRGHFDAMCLMQKLHIAMRDFDQMLFYTHYQQSYLVPHNMLPPPTHHSSVCANEFRDILYTEHKADDRRDIINAGTFAAVFDVYTDITSFQVLGMRIYYWGPDDKVVEKFFSMCRLDNGERAKELLRHYLEMLEKWGIKPEFMVHVSMDNVEVNMGVKRGFAKLLNDIGIYVHITACACHSFILFA